MRTVLIKLSISDFQQALHNKLLTNHRRNMKEGFVDLSFFKFVLKSVSEFFNQLESKCWSGLRLSFAQLLQLAKFNFKRITKLRLTVLKNTNISRYSLPCLI